MLHKAGKVDSVMLKHEGAAIYVPDMIEPQQALERFAQDTLSRIRKYSGTDQVHHS